jgi:predicted dehydrogenase
MPPRWGILGAARIARQAVVPAIREAGGEVVVVGCRDRARGEEFASALSVGVVVQGYQAVLDSDIDCVYIPLPNSLHCEWAVAALERGLHVLCEKPLALNRLQARQMAARARSADLLLGEAVMYRHHPRWATLASLLDSGRIGPVRQISGNFAFPLAAGPDYRWEAEMGGGALYDVGSYLVSGARFLAGREPVSACAIGIARRQVDETVAFGLRFPEVHDEPALVASLTCGISSAESQWLRVVGTDGELVIEEPFTAWRGGEPPIRLRTGAGREEEIPSPPADPYCEMVRAFHHSLATGEPFPTSGEEGVANLVALDAVFESLGRDGVPVAVGGQHARQAGGKWSAAG